MGLLGTARLASQSSEITRLRAHSLTVFQQTGAALGGWMAPPEASGGRMGGNPSGQGPSMGMKSRAKRVAFTRNSYTNPYKYHPYNPLLLSLKLKNLSDLNRQHPSAGRACRKPSPTVSPQVRDYSQSNVITTTRGPWPVPTRRLGFPKNGILAQVIHKPLVSLNLGEVNTPNRVGQPFFVLEGKSFSKPNLNSRLPLPSMLRARAPRAARFPTGLRLC